MHAPPTLGAKAFTCAACGVFSHQGWYYLHATIEPRGRGKAKDDKRFKVSYCDCCGEPTIWRGQNLIYPAAGSEGIKPEPVKTGENIV